MERFQLSCLLGASLQHHASETCFSQGLSVIIVGIVPSERCCVGHTLVPAICVQAQSGNQGMTQPLHSSRCANLGSCAFRCSPALLQLRFLSLHVWGRSGACVVAGTRRCYVAGYWEVACVVHFRLVAIIPLVILQDSCSHASSMAVSEWIID